MWSGGAATRVLVLQVDESQLIHDTLGSTLASTLGCDSDCHSSEDFRRIYRGKNK